VIVNVKPEGNRKVVSIESPLLISNNTEYQMNLLKTPAPLDEPLNLREVKEDNNRKVEKISVYPNKVYRMPLTTIIENCSINYLTDTSGQKVYYSLFDNLREKVFLKKVEEDEKPEY